MQKKKATLILDDGSRFEGVSFGYEKPVSGEVVFNTSMTGYTENMTDPSYVGQIVVFTYPLIGNYGIPSEELYDNGLSKFFESDKIHVEAIVVSDYSEDYSHWNAVESLSSWMKRHQVSGITNIDTRALTKLLREKGSMKGKIVFDSDDEIDFKDPNVENQIKKVSCKEVKSYGEGKKTVVLIDCGAKHNIVRCLVKRGVKVVCVPWNYDFTTMDYDGVCISNGPGNPDTCGEVVENIRKAMQIGKPIFGICMGNQLLAKAGGAKIYKLKYGHRSANQPVRQVGSDRCYVTPQNHGFAVDNDTLGTEWEPFFINMNDGSNEGIRHKTKPFFSVQFHPEASGGPTETGYLFDKFVELL